MNENPNVDDKRLDGFTTHEEIYKNKNTEVGSQNLEIENKDENVANQGVNKKESEENEKSKNPGFSQCGLEKNIHEEKELLEEHEMSDNSFARALFGVVLKHRKKPTGSKSSPEASRENFLFGPRKKTTNPNIPPKTEYSQPKKVGKIEPDLRALYPMDFVLKLRSGKSRHQRGYFKEIEPLLFDTPKPENHTRFVCVSDTHNEHNGVVLPEGDVLLHCGDFTLAGRIHEVDSFNEWLGEIPFQHKFVIAGNHELSFDPKIMDGVKKAKEKNSFSRWGSYLNPVLEKDWQSITSRLTNCTYLEDNEVAINGIRIWGSPWQPEFGEWGFNVPRGKEILEKWDKIPGDGIDILMTHGPPVGHGDKVLSGKSVGCVDLLNSVQLRIQPKYHLFGHIHEAYGITTDNFTTYINCSSVNYNYRPVHKPIIFDLPNKDA